MASGMFAASAVAAPATAGASALYLHANPDATTSRVLYFPETGHHVSGEYLRRWGRMGGMATLGPADLGAHDEAVGRIPGLPKWRALP